MMLLLSNKILFYNASILIRLKFVTLTGGGRLLISVILI
jgi:hypothetical protein